MLFSAIFMVPTVVHAATGQVSVNGGNEILASGTATTVSVPIQISGSDSLNGFDVQVVADPTILQGASVSLSGSVITSPTIVVECINGILVVGTTCAPQDGSGVVHLAVVQIGSLLSGTGLLFTINYNIVGQSALSPITFNTGCSGTSVASGDCVTISNGQPTALSETDLSGSFANLNDFSMAADFTALSTTAGTPISDNINYVALGAFSAVLTETVTSPCTQASSSVDLTFGSGSDMLTCSSATNGDFGVTVTATGGGVTHSVHIALHVGPAGFSSALSPTSLTISRGTSGTTQVTLTGVSSFSGVVTITATGPSGITGSASPSMVTLTPDASGYSTGTATLTVSVDNTVASGVYSVSVTGGSTLSVTVPSSDFAINAVPNSLFVPRGSTIATQINLASTGSFAGTLTLSATVTPVALDNDGVNNIVSAFFPTTITLISGGNGASAYSGSTVKIGTSPNPANTATGNYTVTITATSGSISHSVRVTLLIQDFVLGPNFCAGKTHVLGSPNGEWPDVFIGVSCNTFTVTTQTVGNGGGQSNLWVTVQSLGGLQTNGASFTPGIQAGNPALPGRGLSVPELGFRVCFFQTFWANGTEISTSYLRANGPIVRGDPTDGCRGDGEAFPDDVGASGTNLDYYAITAESLTNTLPGTYGVNVCGEIGTLVNCEMVTLNVVTLVNSPTVSQFLWTRGTGFSASRGGHIQIVLNNTNPTQTVYAQVELTAIGSNGDILGPTGTLIIKMAPNSISNTLNISVPLTKSMVGETFIFSTIILYGTDQAIVIAAQGNQNFGQPFPYVTSTTIVGYFSSSFTVQP